MYTYTAVFGNIRDSLCQLPEHDSTVIYDAYMDCEAAYKHPTGWNILPPVWEHKTNPRMRARRHKMLPHLLYPDAEYSLWVDGCLTPMTEPHELVNRYLQHCDMCLFRHMQRGCVYEEAEACIKLEKDDPRLINKLMARYRREGYPVRNGLAETTAVLRRHTPAMNGFNELWWDELRNNSVRDQLSFDYLSWKTKMPYVVFDGTRTSSPHFHWRAHR